MIKDKVIIGASASFEQKAALMTTLKKYAQYSDEHFACWDEFAFTTNVTPQCDGLLIFNTPGEKIQTYCCPEKVIAFMMEPGNKSEHPWMFQDLDQYHTVYSPVIQSENTVASHGFLGWYFSHSYTYFKNLPVPVKTKTISCIASGLQQLKGHRSRLRFVKILQQAFPEIDFFGKDSHFLPDKLDGLLPYRYSIAIENTSKPHYFTEKINDCFLAYTVPVYYGCKNIGRYFPERSFVQIDIEKPQQAINKINSLITEDDWYSRLEAVKEARELVLNKYQPLAGAAHILRQIQSSAEKKTVTLTPVQPGLLKKIKTTLHKIASI